jgi:hypothetical protein
MFFVLRFPRYAFAFVLVSQLINAASGNVYYFSNLGNDQAGNGSQVNPWRSIAKFNSLDLAPGDSVLFRGGDTFMGSMSLDQNDSGTDTSGNLIAPIRIGSYGSGRATVRSSSTSAAFTSRNNGGIELRDLEFTNGGSFSSNSASGIQFELDDDFFGPAHVSHLLLDNVVSRGFHRSGASFYSAGSIGYDSVTITNSEFYNNQFAGIEVGAAEWTDLIHSNLRVDGVIARNNPGFSGCSPHCGHGIVVGQVDNAVIENSVAHSNGVVAGKGNVGIWAWQSSNVVIQKNAAYGNRSPLGGDGGGFDLDGGVTNSVVQYNVAHDNAGAGYLLAQFAFAEPQQQNTFRYNLSVNDGLDNYGAITVWGEDSSSIAESAVFHNNTIVVDKSVSPATRGPVYFLNANHDDVDFINNVFVALNDVSLLDGPMSTSRSHFLGNAYWTDGDPIRVGGIVYSSIAEWAATTQQEILNGEFVGIEENPQFGPNGDFRLNGNSALVDAGLPVSSGAWPAWLTSLGLSDLYGTSLPQGTLVDIGAVETPQNGGDYNRDGAVDAADYIVWRYLFGSNGTDLLADGNGDGVVDGVDYGNWRRHFAQQAAANAGSVNEPASQRVPEPGSLLSLLGLAILKVSRIGRRWRHD